MKVYTDPSELGDPAQWVTCCKCLRLSHLQCFDKYFPSSDMASSVCFHCRVSSALTQLSSQADTPDTPTMKCVSTEVSMEAGDSSPCKKLRTIKELFIDSKKQGFLDIPLFDQEALAAAKLVSVLAVKEAAVAKAKAFALAEVAAKAAARAKIALDFAYRAGQDDARCEAQIGRQSVSRTSHPLMDNEGGSIQEGIQEGRKDEKVDMRMVRNDHGGQVTRTFAPIQKNEASIVTPSADPFFSSKEETTEMPFNSSETTLEDFSFSMHDIDEQSHEKLGLEVIALASSEGLLSASSRLDVMQDPPHLSIHQSCASRPEGASTARVTHGFTDVNGVHKTEDMVHGIQSCLQAMSSCYNSQELEGGPLVSAQTATLLSGVDLTNRGLLQYRVVQDENAISTGILSSDGNSGVTPSGIDAGCEEVNFNNTVTASQFLNSKHDVCPDIPVKVNSFSSNLVKCLEECTGSELIGNEDQVRYEANVEVADSTLNWAAHEPELQCALMGSGTDQADNFIMSNVSNTPAGLACPSPVITPALSGVLAGWHP